MRLGHIIVLAASLASVTAYANLDAWQSECLQGKATACHALGAEERLAGNRESARGWHDRACRLGNRASCFDMAMLSEALGDPAAAQRGYELACKGGEKRACIRLRAVASSAQSKGSLAAAARSNSTVNASVGHNDAALSKACDSGASHACFTLAGVKGRAKDPNAEQRLLERACRLGSIDGCLANAERIGDAQACHQAGRRVCFEMSKRLQAIGRNASASKLRSTACVLGEEQACKPAQAH